MTRTLIQKRTDADPVAAATRLVATTGAAVMSSFDVTQNLGAGSYFTSVNWLTST